MDPKDKKADQMDKDIEDKLKEQDKTWEDLNENEQDKMVDDVIDP